jgi:hypothetical protein
MDKRKNFVTKQKMPGAHVFATQEQSDSLYTAFNFNGIPHYVLIDKQGNIDEYEFVVHPVLAGHGPTLFAGLIETYRLEAREPAGVRLGGGGDAV